MRLRDIDLPLLMQASDGDVRGHLERILRARIGSDDANRSLLEETEGHYQAISARFRLAPAFEDRFVVPSSTSRDFPDEEVSHKGATLLRLSRLGYPVPDFSILTAEAYRDRRRSFNVSLARAVENLERLTGQRLGSASDPLVIALRCAMPRYAPGMLPTYLNVGICERTLPALARVYGRRAADRMYLNNLRNLLLCLGTRGRGILADGPSTALSDAELIEGIRAASDHIRAAAPRLLDDSLFQLHLLSLLCYRQYHGLRDLLFTVARGERQYPALILQKMVCSVRDERSYAGVFSTRNPRTGKGFLLETGRNIFGEDIMTGTAETQRTASGDIRDLRRGFPAVYHFAPLADSLEKEFQSPVTVEFAAETHRGNELFALLQVNETGMTGRAAFVSVVDLHQSGVISRKRVAELIQPYHVKQMESDSIPEGALQTLSVFCSGVAILPSSAVCAKLYFQAEEAMKAKKRGERVCFCKRAFLPTDTIVMREVDAIVSLTSAAIHLVTICQTYGTPGLLNLEREGVSLTEDNRLVNAQGLELAEGDWVTLSSRRQKLFKGRANFTPARFARFLKGESTDLDDRERRVFTEMAYAYRYYCQLVRALKLDQISTLKELIRLVNLDLRGEKDEARRFVNGWFDGREELYVREVFKSDMGDHLNQSTVFEMLAPERKVRFFQTALRLCRAERRSGYAAGAFMLGRFIHAPQRVALWKALAAGETAALLNEWLLFEKYMRVLYDVGERRVARARKQILKDGLGEIPLDPKTARNLVTLKLAGTDRAAARKLIPEWADAQMPALFDLLDRPYGDFFDYTAPWAKEKFAQICLEAGSTLPDPTAV